MLADRCRSATATPNEIFVVADFVDHCLFSGPDLRTDIPLEILRSRLLGALSRADRRYRRVALVLDAARSSRRRPLGPALAAGDIAMTSRLVVCVRSRASVAGHAELALALGLALACLGTGEGAAPRRAALELQLTSRYGQHYGWCVRPDA